MRNTLLAIVVSTVLPVVPLAAQDEFPTTEPTGNPPASSGFTWPTLSLPKLPLPKLGMPTFRLLPKRQPSTSSAWERFNEGTRSFFAKTRDVLMPWAEPSPGAAPRTAQRNRSALFGPRETAREIETVNDYLELPRPMPFE